MTTFTPQNVTMTTMTTMTTFYTTKRDNDSYDSYDNFFVLPTRPEQKLYAGPTWRSKSFIRVPQIGGTLIKAFASPGFRSRSARPWRSFCFAFPFEL